MNAAAPWIRTTEQLLRHGARDPRAGRRSSSGSGDSGPRAEDDPAAIGGARTHGTLAALAVGLLAASLLGAGCSADRNAAGPPFTPAEPGVLTVATAFLPAPGFWQGRRFADGFEARLARALAHRLGVARVVVVQRSFAEIVAGHLGRADIALSQLTPTRAREHSLAFTTAYIDAPPGVLVRPGVQARDVEQLRGLRWVESSLSTLTPIVRSRVRPSEPAVVVDDRTAALAVLRSGRADALLLDLPVALGLAHAEPQQYRVAGQLDGENALAVALPKGSGNVQIVDSEIRALQADGTIGRLASRWLGGSGAHVPLILTEQN